MVQKREPTLMNITKRIVKNYTPLLKIKNNPLSIETECLYGEEFTILKKSTNWYYGYLNNDNCHGWLQKNSIDYITEPNFCVSASRTFILNKPNIKSLTIDYLSIGSVISVNYFIDEWAQITFIKKNTTVLGYVPKVHLIEINSSKLDWVKFAESMLGVPYKWGGKTSFGIDCSGLVQMSLNMANIACPRNSSDQQEYLGSNLFCKWELESQCFIELWNLKVKRGDVIFWKGHVGVANRKSTIIHANGDTNNVAIENSNKLINKYMKKKLIPLAIKRLNSN